MSRTVTIRGTAVAVDVTDTDLAEARASLLRFGRPGDEFFAIAAGSYVRAAEDRLTYPPAIDVDPQRAYATARRDHALVAAYAELAVGDAR